MSDIFNMETFLQDKTLLVPYILLAFSLLSLWFTRQRIVWGTFLVLGVIAGFFTHRLALLVLLSLIPLPLLVYFSFHHAKKAARIICGIIGLVLGMALYFHYMPGFNNLKIADQVILTPDALPYSLFLNFDKTLYGLFLLAFGWTFINHQPISMKTFKVTLFITLITLIVMPILSMSIGYVHFEPKWTRLFSLWAPVNLIFVCTIEETIFRGLIQRSLTKFYAFPYGKVVALVVAAILFGLSHFHGGVTYILVSTVAGLFYGTAYLITGRIEASILTHFTLNAVHFLLFTYPALNSIILKA